MRSPVGCAIAVLIVAGAGASACGKDVAVRVVVSPGDVTEDIYRLRVASVLDGDPRDTVLFPPEPRGVLDLPSDFVLAFAHGTTGTLEITVEALDQAETTVIGFGELTVTIPEPGAGEVPGDVTLASPMNDADGDMVPDLIDNCPGDANMGQADCDTDGEGDVCDADCACCLPDVDMDGVPDADDNCPDDPNPLQEDTVPAAPDGIGDACGDFDMDGSGDLDDCAPEDGGVFPGNADPCDGVDADCAPSVCAFDLAGMQVNALAVSSAGRIGITLDGAGGAGTGAFRTFDGMDATTAVLTTATIDDPRGVAVNIAPLHADVNDDRFYVTDPTMGLLRDYDAPTGAVQFAGYPVAGVGDALTFSPFGELGLAPLGTMNGIVVFDPCESAGPDCYESAGNTTMLDPMTIDLVTSSTASPNPGLGLDPSWRVRSLALRSGSVINFPQVAYLIFNGQSSIVGLSVNPTTLNSDSTASGLVPMSGTAPATALLYDAANDDLLATSGDGVTDGELRVFAANDITSMMSLLSAAPVTGAGLPSCPSGVALGTDNATLWVADACNDVVWEGTKSTDGMTVTLTTAHDVCASPSHLGVVASPGGDLVYVGCAGALGVVGSD